jgi:hypothetical protein
MKYLTITLILFLILPMAYSQDNRLATSEVGLKVVSGRILTRAYHSIINRPSFQFIDGLFYRISKKHMALRLALDLPWNQRNSLYESTIFTTSRPYILKSRDINIAIGGQYDLLKEKKWLYVFTEVYYRNINTSGELVDNHLEQIVNPSLNNKFSVSNKRIGLNSGIGFKMKVLDHLFISPELFYDLYYSYTTLEIHDKSGNIDYRFFSKRINYLPNARVLITMDF